MNNKELKALLKLLRSNGVLTYKTADLDLSFSSESHLLAPKEQAQMVEVDSDDPWAQFPTGDLTPEQLMFYSSGGVPGEEPDEEAIPQ
jgi:hypothetical protein